MSTETSSSPSPQHDPSPPAETRASATTEPREPTATADYGRGVDEAVNGGMRASHAEREQTVATLHGALGDGRLDLDETEARVASAYAARFRHELPTLTADLPADRGRAPGDAPTWASIAVDLVWRARATVWADTANERPTSHKLRVAVAVAVVALLWFLLCAVVAAGLVAA